MAQEKSTLSSEQVDSEARSRSSVGRRSSKGVKRRQEILDHTLEVFNDRGFEGASLRAIAESIGLTHAAITRYFETREELFLEVLREADVRAAADLEASPGAGHFALRAAEVSFRTPGFMALFNAMVARALEAGNQASREYFVDRYERLRLQISSTLLTGREAGVVRDDIPIDVAASLLLAAADGLSTQWLLDHHVDIRAGMELLDRLLGTEEASTS